MSIPALHVYIRSMSNVSATEVVSWNFGDLFDALAPALGTRPALIHGGIVRSWEEFGARSNRLARALRARGLAPNDKVAFFLRNSPAYLELFAASVKARLVHVNVNYRYVETELLHVLRNSDAKAVVFDEEFVTQIDALRHRLSDRMVFVSVADVEGTPGSDIESAVVSKRPATFPMSGCAPKATRAR
jgi:3-oxocholest-4-en-26-oate---CoA ligase